MPVNTSDTDFLKDILDFDEQERKLKKKIWKKMEKTYTILQGVKTCVFRIRNTE